MLQYNVCVSVRPIETVTKVVRQQKHWKKVALDKRNVSFVMFPMRVKVMGMDKIH